MVVLGKAAGLLPGALTAAAFLGTTALVVLPAPGLPSAEDSGPRAVRIARAERPKTPPAPNPVRRVAADTTAAPPVADKAAEPAEPQVQAPASSPGTEPRQRPEGWTDAEMREALEACLELLGPIAAEIDVVPAPKHGACGTPAAVLVKSVGTPRVEFNPPATMNCKMVAALHTWVSRSLQPAAKEALGQHATRMTGTSAYSCRTRYGLPGERLSEHAFANAIDIGGFGLAGGRVIDILGHWGPTERDIAAAKAKAAAEAAKAAETKGDRKSGEAPEAREVYGPPRPRDLDAPPPRQRDAAANGKLQTARMALGVEGKAGGADKPTPESAFLKKLHAGACGTFTTVLGPESNEAHRNHFHFDLAERKRGAFCQ
jgi:hypothetical protein